MSRRLTRFLQAATMAGALIAIPGGAGAQIIVMRKVLGGIVKDKAEQARPVGHWIVGDATVTPGCSATQPSTAPVTCVDQAGGALPSAACSGAKPSGAAVAPNYSTCSYQPVMGDWTDWSSTCSDRAQRFRATWCLRSDGTVLDIGQCPDAAPAKIETAAITTGCTYKASYGQPGACVPGGTYGSDGGPGTMTAHLTSCQRSDGKDLTGASDGFCASTKTTDCTIAPVGHWVVGAAVVTPGCSSSQPTVAPVTCQNSGGKIIGDQFCSAAKPEDTGTAANYDTCTYAAEVGEWGSWTTTCGTDAKRSRLVLCRRSDTTLVDAKNCNPLPSASETQDNFTTCSYQPTYGAPGACVADGADLLTGKQTASLTSCRRSDGTNVTNVAGQPEYCASTRVSTCSLTTTGTYSTTYGACANNVQYAPLTKCTRSDGVEVSKSLCSQNSPPKACTMPPVGSCEAVAGSRWTGKVLDSTQPSVSYGSGNVINSKADVQTTCQAMFEKYGKGSCFYSPSTRNGVEVFPTSLSYRTNYAWVAFSGRSDLTAANCGQ